MTESLGHDEFCGDCTPHDHYCHCSMIARVRADEREQIGRVWAKREDLRDAHAEAVAARLVEVIVQDEATIGYLRNALWDLAHVRHAATADVKFWEARWREAADQREQMQAERDAARAEASEMEQSTYRWHDEFRAMRAQRDAARAEVADLRKRNELAHLRADNAEAEVAALRESGEAIARGMVAQARREVLADLRAKVSSGWVPELDHEARIAVLALLDGADQ